MNCYSIFKLCKQKFIEKLKFFWKLKTDNNNELISNVRENNKKNSLSDNYEKKKNIFFLAFKTIAINSSEYFSIFLDMNKKIIYNLVYKFSTIDLNFL